jgi:hypothetical protein
MGMLIEVLAKALAAVTDFSYFSRVHPDESYDTIRLKQSLNASFSILFHFILFYKRVILWHWIVISDALSYGNQPLPV